MSKQEIKKENDNEEEVSLKTLLIVFGIGLIIILGLYFISINNNNNNNEDIENYELIIEEKDISKYINESNLSNCRKMDMKYNRERIIVGLDKENTSENLISGWTEIVLANDIEELKEISVVILELKSINMTGIMNIDFKIGNGDNFYGDFQKIINLTQNKTITRYDTTNMFKKNYKLIAINIPENRTIGLEKVILCE